MKKEEWKFLPVGTFIYNKASKDFGLVVRMNENPSKKTIQWSDCRLGEELTDESYCVTQFCEVIYQPNNNKNMKITNLIKKIIDKDVRTLISADFISRDLTLTDEGVNELLGILFLEKKEELVKIAQEKIENK